MAKETTKKWGELPNDCWLDGKKAVVSYDGSFVLVRQMDTLLGVYYCVDAATRIMSNDRQFKTA